MRRGRAVGHRKNRKTPTGGRVAITSDRKTPRPSARFHIGYRDRLPITTSGLSNTAGTTVMSRELSSIASSENGSLSSR